MVSENLVKQTLLQKGFLFVAERLRTPFAELDLVFLDAESCLHVFEVKTSEHGLPYVSKKQKLRLHRALEHLNKGRTSYPRCHLALVNQAAVQLVWDFLA